MSRKPEKISDIGKRHSKPVRQNRKERVERKIILIVCEGTKTEPNYFLAFRDYLNNPTINILPIGVAKNTLSLVEEAIELKRCHSADEVWCVFDKDSFPDYEFDNAIKKAKANGLEVAYSNEAFEIWYLYHFDYHTSALSRSVYKDRISQKINKKYEKNDPSIFYDLLDKMDVAISNAKKRHEEIGDHGILSSSNPVTLVYKLVCHLKNLKIN